MSVEERVGITVRGESREAQRAFRDLKREVDATAEGAKKFSVDLGGVTTALIGINQGLGVAQKAIAAFKQAWSFVREAAEIRQFARQVDQALVDQVQAAVGGTIDRLTIMREMARHGAANLGLTAEQIRNVWIVVDQLSNQGFGPAEQVAERYFQALRTGSTRTLRDYGIQVSEAGTRQERLNSILEETARRVREVHVETDPTKIALDRWEAGWRDFWTGIKVGAIDATDAVVDFYGAWGLARDDFYRRVGLLKKDHHRALIQLGDVEAPRRPGGLQVPREPPLLQTFDMQSPEALADDPASPLLTRRERERRWVEDARREWMERERRRRERERLRDQDIADATLGMGRDFEERLDRETGLAALRGPGAGFAGGLSGIGQRSQLAGALGLDPAELAKLREELNAITEAQEMYRDVSVDAASAVLGATMQAIDGQADWLDASRRAIGGVMRARGLEYGAMAIGAAAEALFFGQPQKAAAAALYAKASAAMLAGSALLGVGGGGPPVVGGGIPGGGFARPTAGSAGGGVNVTIHVSGSNPRENAIEVSRALEEARRKGLLPSGPGASRVT